VAPVGQDEAEQGKRYPRVKPTFLKKSKYRHLLDDPQVDRWFRNLLRGSAVTAAERLRRLGWLCEHFEVVDHHVLVLVLGHLSP